MSKKSLFIQITLIIGAMALVHEYANTTEYVLPISVSLFLTWCAWLASGRNPATFCGLTVIYCAMLYPVTAMMDVMFSVPIMHYRMWETGTIGLWAYSIGAAGLIMGFLVWTMLAKLQGTRRQTGTSSMAIQDHQFESVGVPVLWVILIFIIIFYVIGFLGKLFGGFFYYDYTDFDLADRWMFLDYFRAGGFLLTCYVLHHRLVVKASGTSVILCLAVLSLLLAYSLSGSRGVIVFPVLYLAIYGFSLGGGEKSWVRFRWKRAATFVVIAMGVGYINTIWLIFRDRSQGIANLTDRSGELLGTMKDYSILETEMFSPLGLLGQIAYRFEEFGWAGRTVDYFSGTDPVGFEGFARIPEFVLPSFLRWTPYYEATDDVTISMKINREITSGAPPITVIGDLFRRFGRTGVFWGMCVMGLFLSWLDHYFSKNTLHRRFHFLLYWFNLLTIHLTMGIQTTLIMLIRPFFITWAIAFLLTSLIWTLSRTSPVTQVAAAEGLSSP